jgi:hypothetical protein
VSFNQLLGIEGFRTSHEPSTEHPMPLAASRMPLTRSSSINGSFKPDRLTRKWSKRQQSRPGTKRTNGVRFEAFAARLGRFHHFCRCNWLAGKQLAEPLWDKLFMRPVCRYGTSKVTKVGAPKPGIWLVRKGTADRLGASYSCHDWCQCEQ